jgi:hypothetical protein
MIIDESFKSQETAAYVQVTHYQDSSPIQDRHCDGVLYRKQDGLYFRRIGADPLNVLWFGLKNDGATYNELALAHLLKTVSGPLNLFFPQGVYRFKALPASQNIMGQPVAISFIDREVLMSGEAGTELLIDPGCIGIQITRSSGGSLARFENFNIRAASKDANDGKVAGPNGLEWGTNAGDHYKFNGINLYNQGYLRNVNVNGFSGHGVAIFGHLGVRVDSARLSVPGTAGQWNGDLIFTPDDPYFMGPEFPSSGAIVLDGQVYPMGGKGTQFFTLHYYNGVTPLKHYPDAELFYPGAGLVADNCQFEGVNNFDNNGGCGLFIVGPDSNQGTYRGVSVRENGFWGILDFSFLGSHNGINFSGTSTPVGSFCTTDINARSTWVGCYSESGNQSASQFADNTVVIGGHHAAGIAPTNALLLVK